MTRFSTVAFFSLCIALAFSCADSPTTRPGTDSGGGIDAGMGQDVFTPLMCGLRTDCDGTCVDTARDPANCGGCGSPCSSEETCDMGICRPRATCPPGQTDCDGCVDTDVAAAHCGRCGMSCDEGETCMAGACTPATCPAPTERCGAACTDTQTDGGNCGTCGMICGASESCMAGACVSVCEGTEVGCEVEEGGATTTVCVDTMTSPTHCGACNAGCDEGDTCVAGRCACPTGTVACGDACVNTDTDIAHCNGCDMPCATGSTCDGGVCACPAGQEVCDGACVATDISNDHCGMCDIGCETPDETCVAGVCAGACGVGRVECGVDCADLTASPNHCGMCDNACGAGTSCAAGTCRPENDLRAAAEAVTLPADGSEATVMGTTTGATRDGATISGCSANGPNVWYSVTLPTAGVLWADTAGSAYDTAIFVTNSTGTPVNPDSLCNDDCCGVVGDFTTSRQSCGASQVPAGTYFISVGGFVTTSAGDFTLHVQFMPDTGFLWSTPLENTGTTSGTFLLSTSEAAGTCGGGFSSRSGEDMRWFTSCGGTDDHLVSVCPGDGGTYSREIAGEEYDPVLYVWSGQSGDEIECNDDGIDSSVNCQGTGGDAAEFGSRIPDFQVPRGIGAVFIDSRGIDGGGMTYSLRYELP